MRRDQRESFRANESSAPFLALCWATWTKAAAGISLFARSIQQNQDGGAQQGIGFKMKLTPFNKLYCCLGVCSSGGSYMTWGRWCTVLYTSLWKSTCGSASPRAKSGSVSRLWVLVLPHSLLIPLLSIFSANKWNKSNSCHFIKFSEPILGMNLAYPFWLSYMVWQFYGYGLCG